jgi:hypothetical protein
MAFIFGSTRSRPSASATFSTPCCTCAFGKPFR